MNGLFRMIGLVRLHRGRFVWFLAVSLLFAGCNWMYVGVVHTATEILASSRVPAWATWLGVEKVRHAYFILLAGTVCLALMKCVLQYLRRYLQAWVTRRVVLDTQAKLASHLLSMDLAFIQSERVGELLSRVTNDLNALGASVKLTCVLLTRPLELVFLLGAVFYLKWELAVLGLVAAPIGGMIINRLSRKMRRAAKMAQEKKADLTSAMVQFLTGMRTVKAFTCEAFEDETFRAENQRLFNVTMKRERARARVRPSVEFVSFTGSLAVLAVGGEWVFNGTLALPDLVAFLYALAAMYSPAKELSAANSDLQEALPGAERVFEILDRECAEIDGEKTLECFNDSIRYEDVSFRYVENAPVLQHVDLEIQKGSRVALVGPTGSGKSTMSDLVLRFRDPDAGRITLDGTDLRDFTRESLRKHIALVAQEPFLFNCSIRDNIAYGRADATQQAIEDAARAAAVHDEIVAMPEGYDTVVGERGTSLSGGQRQRVAIARALFKDAPILILDEATSSLDAESERKVQAALDYLMEGRTCLVIAHRLSTVRHADKIAILEGGAITAEGRHEELMLASPTYAHFVNLQTSGERGEQSETTETGPA